MICSVYPEIYNTIATVILGIVILATLVAAFFVGKGRR